MKIDFFCGNKINDVDVKKMNLFCFIIMEMG